MFHVLNNYKVAFAHPRISNNWGSWQTSLQKSSDHTTKRHCNFPWKNGVLETTQSNDQWGTRATQWYSKEQNDFGHKGNRSNLQNDYLLLIMIPFNLFPISSCPNILVMKLYNKLLKKLVYILPFSLIFLHFPISF